MDEAHHVYGYRDDDKVGEAFCKRVEECCKGSQDRILLSDISQSSEGIDDGAIMERFPAVVHSTERRFNLDEVVRSTEIGVLGAMVSLKSLPSPSFSVSINQQYGSSFLVPKSTTLS